MIGLGEGIKFRCSARCIVCCVIRDYPRIYAVRDPKSGEVFQIAPESLGKEGMVEIEQWELPKLTKLANEMNNRVDEKGNSIQFRFVPAWGVGPIGAKAPKKIISYWLMGRFEDGDMCPFLSTPSENLRTEDGSLKCLVYEDRPLQCRAYPVHQVYVDRITGEKVVVLDQGCQRVVETSLQGDKRLAQPVPISVIRGLDLGAFSRLQSNKVDSRNSSLWVHATGVYGKGDRPARVIEGWVEVPQA